jgi:hypothetical protein
MLGKPEGVQERSQPFTRVVGLAELTGRLLEWAFDSHIIRPAWPG